MSRTRQIIRKIGAHLAGIVGYLAVALAGSIAYVYFFKTTGPKVDGMIGGAIVLFLPMMLTGFGIVIWSLGWAFLNYRYAPVTAARAFVSAAVLAVLATIVYCGGGAGCFLPGRHEHYVGWFFVLSAALAATAHTTIYRRIAGTAG